MKVTDYPGLDPKKPQDITDAYENLAKPKYKVRRLEATLDVREDGGQRTWEIRADGTAEGLRSAAELFEVLLYDLQDDADAPRKLT